MPLKPFHKIPDDLREWGEWCRNTTVEPGDATVTESMLVDNAATNRVLRDSQAYSVIGNPTASAANPSDIAAGADGVFLGRRAGAVQFVSLQDSDIPPTIARDDEVTAEMGAHEAAANPHPDYVTTAELAIAEAAHEGEANPHAVYPLIAGTPTISGAWTFGNSATRFNFTTGTTAPSAGGAGALPATPAGYVTVNIGGVNRQIPYY
jgi:hypothetical protein